MFKPLVNILMSDCSLSWNERVKQSLHYPNVHHSPQHAVGLSSEHEHEVLWAMKTETWFQRRRALTFPVVPVTAVQAAQGGG